MIGFALTVFLMVNVLEILGLSFPTTNVSGQSQWVTGANMPTAR
jgi:hypothetical protein